MKFALKLLGGLALEGCNGPVPTGALQRRRLALLAILALGGERGVSRERVQAQLWPESPDERARHALDQLLYATRRDLGRDAILSSATHLRLNPAVVRPDVWGFDEAIRAAQWADAVDLYAGPLLPGLHLVDCAEFEHWLDAERMRLDHEYHRALEALAREATARGDQGDALRWWWRRAAADPLSAPVALELMRALAAAGDRAGAIQHARVHQRMVRDTLEIDPDPAIAALATQLAEASTSCDAVGAARPAGPPSPPARPARVDLSPAEEAGARPTRPLAAAPAPNAERVSDVSSAPVRLARSRIWLVRAGAIVVVLGLLAAAPLFQGRPLPAGSSTTTHAEAGGAPSPPARAADPQARALSLRARTAWEKRTKDGLEEAVVLYRLAAERDPEYAAAYTGLAESYAMLGYFGFAPPDAMFPKARASALRALELDPTSGEAHAALGQALAWQHDWTAAEQAYRRALELAPANPTVHQWYGLMLAYMGRTREAALHTGEASRLDPLSVQINNMYGVFLYHDGDLAGALRQYERTVVAEPDSAWVRQNPWVLSNFAHVAAAAGRHEQALQLLDRALQVVPTHPRALLDLAFVWVQAGEPDRARAAFARADTTNPQYVVYRAELHALLGEMDEAFAWLDRVDEWPLPALVGLNNDRRFAPLRADPRFQAIRQRLGLPPR